ncbi:complement C4-like, partial [Stegostoma tigrinum]|uniref:complement C4-like n=1 Tax=Stegostoma tigrinum TaxID=3053191 RepID=UPI002870313A
SCPQPKNILSTEVSGSARIDFACYSPIVDYAYTIRVDNITTTGYFENYQVSITRLVKIGNKDEGIKINDIRHFLKRRSCQLQLQKGEDYFVMGQDGRSIDESGRIQYLFDAKSWIEEIPSADTCELRKYRSACKSLNDSMDDLVNRGCQI